MLAAAADSLAWSLSPDVPLATQVGSVLAGIVLLFRRRFPTLTLIVGVVATYTLFTGYLLSLLVLYSFGRYARSRRLLLMMLTVVLVTGVLPIYVDGAGLHVDTFNLADVTGVAAITLPPVLLGLNVRTHRELLASVRDRDRQVERERELLTQHTRDEERARLAREMHDVVAHKVSLIAVHAGAAEAVVAKDPGTALRSVRLVGDTARQALEELRGVLNVLRTQTDDCAMEPPPTLADLESLVQRSRDAGVPVTLEIEGEPGPLPATVERTAVCLIREALTNIHKHAGRVSVTVRLVRGAAALAVRVENVRPVTPPELTLPGSGLGLAGMRERVALLGGSFEAGQASDGGFVVSALLPVSTA